MRIEGGCGGLEGVETWYRASERVREGVRNMLARCSEVARRPGEAEGRATRRRRRRGRRDGDGWG